MTMDETDLFSKTHYTHSHSAMHSNPHNDELHECPICVFRTLEIPKVPDAYSHVFSTNDPPDDTLLASLRSSLAVIRSLSAEIEKHLATIQHAKDACALSIKKHEAAVHPIRSLPDDILLTIFRWHIHSKTDKSIGEHDSYLRLPWSLSQVSHRWRTLTLSSPVLWIAFNVRHCHHNQLPTLEAKWNQAIERSADCGLVVAIDDGTTRYYDIPSLIENLRILSRTTTRWRKLTIHATHSFLEPLATCSFEHLTELVWNLSCSDAPKTEFQNTVNLRRLTVLGSAPLDVNWEQITDYICNPAGFQHLPKLTAMKHLTLDRTTFPPSPPILTLPVSLPILRSISMRGGQSLRQISQLLHVPSLNDLAIMSQDFLPEFRGPLLKLRHLNLLSNAPLDGISSFLARHDSVESLYTLKWRVMELLRVTPGHPIILPNLRSLSISTDALLYDTATFFEVVESRCGDDRGNVVRLMELELVGTEWTERTTMKIISEEPTGKLLERWDTVLQKISLHFAEQDENVWRFREY